ncbi:MAG TPA: metallophosphoesterase family protein [Gemmatimonadaceae bacterium]|nr:metallophosphoesterase family protein [Gemmatimonadaceae bacterium]
MTRASSHLIGLISDTHGLVRPAVHEVLKGVEIILHAGDVGGPEILDELQIIAPVRAVFGNTDPPGMPGLTESIDTDIGGVRIHVSHGNEVGSPTPEKLAARYNSDVVIYGHTHRQLVTPLNGQLFVNPGAAGPRRFRLSASVGILKIAGGKPEVSIVDIA